VWLAGHRTSDLTRAADRAAARLGLPLEVLPVPPEAGLADALRTAIDALQPPVR
jgi:hypothetical protein